MLLDARLGDIVDVALSGADDDERRLVIGRLLLESLQADYFCSFLVDESGPFAEVQSLNMPPELFGRYRSYYRHRDTLTPELMRCGGAVAADARRVAADTAGREFGRDFLQANGLWYGMNYFPADPGPGSFDFRIWRSAGGRPFGDRELRLLQRAGDLLERTWSRGMAARTRTLTVREAEVARLISTGASDKEIRRELGLAQGTLRTHTSRIFTKLDASNRSQVTAAMVRWYRQ